MATKDTETRSVETGLVQVQIVNYLNWQSTINCIRSVRRQTYDKYRVIVIENASPNNSLGRVRDFDSGVPIIVSQTNVGWGAALNLGFFHHPFDTAPEFYMTVNSDASLEPTCLAKLVRTMRTNPDCAIASPVIFEDETRTNIHNVGFNLSYRYLLPIDIAKLTGCHKVYFRKCQRKVSWIDDTVALMRRRSIHFVDGYDERYFMYGQMTDMGYRLRQEGYSFIVNYDAVAYHKGKGSSGGRLSSLTLYYKLRNWIIFQRKYFSHLPYTIIWALFVSLIYVIRVVKQGNVGLIRDIARGVRDGLKYTL